MANTNGAMSRLSLFGRPENVVREEQNESQQVFGEQSSISEVISANEGSPTKNLMHHIPVRQLADHTISLIGDEEEVPDDFSDETPTPRGRP